MRFPAPDWASATMVMRETPMRSEWPTVSEMMLMLRRRKSEATRVSTPGLSSTSATNVWSNSRLSFRCLFVTEAVSLSRSGGSAFGVFGIFDQRVPAAAGTAGVPVAALCNCGAPDHVVQGRARADHRVDGVFLFYEEVDEERPLRLPRRVHRWQYFGAGADGRAWNFKGTGKLDEVGAQDGRAGVILLVEKLLPLPHHAEEAVVDDGDVDVQVFLRDGCEFRAGHLEAAVAGDDPDFLVWARDFCADRGGQRESHGAQAARSD